MPDLVKAPSANATFYFTLRVKALQPDEGTYGTFAEGEIRPDSVTIRFKNKGFSEKANAQIRQCSAGATAHSKLPTKNPSINRALEMRLTKSF
jgi:hypothetical protein